MTHQSQNPDRREEINRLIKKFLHHENGSGMRSSAEYYAQTGYISGSLYMNLNSLLNHITQEKDALLLEKEKEIERLKIESSVHLEWSYNFQELAKVREESIIELSIELQAKENEIEELKELASKADFYRTGTEVMQEAIDAKKERIKELSEFSKSCAELLSRIKCEFEIDTPISLSINRQLTQYNNLTTALSDYRKEEVE